MRLVLTPSYEENPWAINYINEVYSCQGMFEGTRGSIYLSAIIRYLWHDVPGTALVRPSINVTSTEDRFNNSAISWGHILSSDGS